MWTHNYLLCKKTRIFYKDRNHFNIALYSSFQRSCVGRHNPFGVLSGGHVRAVKADLRVKLPPLKPL